MIVWGFISFHFIQEILGHVQMPMEVIQERQRKVDNAREKVDKGRVKVLEKGRDPEHSGSVSLFEAFRGNGKAGSKSNRVQVNWWVWWWEGEWSCQFTYIFSVNYDFRSSFENELGLLNPEPKCTVSFIYHLVHLEKKWKRQHLLYSIF